MQKIALIFALMMCIGPVYGQFQNLATNNDGSLLYVSSSLLLEGIQPTQWPELRIFQVAPDVRLAIARTTSQGPTNSFGTGDGADLAQVSGDGQTLGYTLRGICDQGQQPCVQPITVGELQRGGQIMRLGEGTLQLSRNARWALLDPSLSRPQTAPAATLIDLSTGERRSAPVPPPRSVASVASDGTILAAASPPNQPQGLWRNGVLTPLLIEGASSLLALSDNAQVVLYYQLQITTPGLPRLFARNLTTGRDTLLFSSAESGTIATLMGLSNDGSRALYRTQTGRAEGPAFLADTSTGAATPLPLPAGVLASAGTLSGDGNVVYLVTTEGRIVRIRITQGAPGNLETVVPATPSVETGLGLVPGSLTRLRGTGLPQDVAALRGRILVGGLPAPVLFAANGEIGIQVPWEAATSLWFDALFSLDLPSTSPFRQQERNALRPISPRPEQADPGVSSLFGLKFIKADFSGYVTGPPQPGEIIHLYMTGLGAVIGAVQTGEPAPVDSLRPTREPFQCRFLPQTTPAETLFAGLAPGLIGIYQVTFRMPHEPTPPRLTGMNCSGFGFAVVGVP